MATSHAQNLPQELLLRVFMLLDRRSNARNARVCKAWREGALDEVWRELHDWTSVLPSFADTVKDPLTRKMSFSSVLTNKDVWDCIVSNSHRVRHLDGSNTTIRWSESAMIQIMSTRPPSVLFPRLLSLKIDSDSGPQFGTIVMHHSISALTITFDSFHQMDFQELALHVTERMPNLTTLDLDVPIVEARMLDGLLHLLENLPRLQEVTLSPTMFSSYIIEPLAALNSLRVLSSSIPDDDGWVDCPDSFYFPLEEGAFPSLQSISFGASLSEARRLLEEPHFPASSMTSIILNVPCPLRETPSRLRKILQSLADSFHYLQRLEFSMVDIHTEELAQPLPVFDFTDISPVLRLRHLKAFTIRYLRPITITNDQLESLAASLPQLEELVLTAYPMFTPKPTLTLPSIISFALHCPNMKKLALYLRTSDIALLPSADARFNHLAQLWIGYSGASGDIEKICRFLYPLLPQKCEIMATVDECCDECNYVRDPTRWETEDEEARVGATNLWRDVERTIRLMNHAREDAERVSKSLKKTLPEELRVAIARSELGPAQY